MKSYDFEFDGLQLSDMGYVICNFGSDSQTNIMGSELSFNTISQLHGTKQDLINATYNNRLETTFQICKKNCDSDVKEISIDEIREIYSWLNRKKFHKFKLLSDEYMDLYFEGSFNISYIEIGGKVYGFELNFISNRPFALHEPKILTINNTKSNDIHFIHDTSDEEGCIYPIVEIQVLNNGDLSIKNELDNRITYIRNCENGEIITMNYPKISSSNSSHSIQNDFNWNFFRIVNTFKDKKNPLKISIPCKMKIIYSPIVKVGL